MSFRPTHAAPKAALSVTGLEARTTPAALPFLTLVAADTGAVFEVPVADPVFGDGAEALAGDQPVTNLADQPVANLAGPRAAFLTLRAADTGEETVVEVADPVFNDGAEEPPAGDQPVTNLADGPAADDDAVVEEAPAERSVPWWRAGLRGVALTFDAAGSPVFAGDFEPIRVG